MSDANEAGATTDSTETDVDRGPQEPPDGGATGAGPSARAPLTSRAGAFLVDLVLVGVGLALVWAVFAGIQFGFLRLLGLQLGVGSPGPLAVVAVGVIRVVMVVAVAVLLLGYLWRLTAGSGQTYGKRFFDVRVVAADGGPVGRRASLVRTGVLVLPLPLVMAVGVFAPLWWIPIGLGLFLGWFALEGTAILAGTYLRDDPRRLGDHLAGTRVVET